MIPDELTPPIALATEVGTPGITEAEALQLLRDGELTIEGRVVHASNATFYSAIRCGELSGSCVYKPVAGERPLWDFPDGTLAGRETAAYEVSAATGWAIVPPTVYREGPAGPGMVQLWIDTDDEVDLGRLMRRRDLTQLRRIAVLDAVINNADRKGGHLLPTPAGHLYGIDHGVSFHAEDKLRTVLWQWSGARLTTEARNVLTSLRVELEAELGARLGELLTRGEVRRTAWRVERLLTSGCHVEPGDGWPPVPWPPI